MLPARLIYLPVSEVLGIRGSYALSEDLSFPPSVLTHHSPTRPPFPRLPPGIFSIFKAYSRANRKQKVKGEKKAPLHGTNDYLHYQGKASTFGQLIKYTDTPSPPALPAPVPGNGDSSRDKEPSAMYCLGSRVGGGGLRWERQETGRGRASPSLPSRGERRWPSCPARRRHSTGKVTRKPGGLGSRIWRSTPRTRSEPSPSRRACPTARKQRVGGGGRGVRGRGPQA